ncbi:MAG: CPBP family intramembrane metalloprotease, partial [Lachnospiraceae bacterium]|nr:CPBP family intramembrane metalloprotease [Lachnospiraceae bacterium]
LLAGFGMFTVTMLVTVFATGGHIEWFGTLAPWFFFVALFCFAIQSSAEEIDGRSCIFLSTARKHPDWISAVISGAFFGGIHLTNPGVTVLSTLNSALIGVMFCLLVLLFENVWIVCAMHTPWNFAQGNIYGLLVWGHDAGGSILKATIESENELLSGGAYGVESNLITTVLILILIVVLAIVLKNKARDAE